VYATLDLIIMILSSIVDTEDVMALNILVELLAPRKQSNIFTPDINYGPLTNINCFFLQKKILMQLSTSSRRCSSISNSLLGTTNWSIFWSGRRNQVCCFHGEHHSLSMLNIGWCYVCSVLLILPTQTKSFM